MTNITNIAVLSDIHGNYCALKKCVELALEKNVKIFLFLGDYVGDLGYPQKTMEYLYALKQQYTCYFIRGNKENYWLDYKKNGGHGWDDHHSTTGTLLYTYQNLTEKDFSFFESLPHKRDILFEGFPPLTICHGSPDKINEHLRPGDQHTLAIMDREKNTLILNGHTHIQASIEHNGKRLLNAGSAGIPLHSGGKAQFMILHGADRSWEHEFFTLEYDVETVISDLYSAGLDKKAPYWCRITENLLRKGTPSHGAVLERAMFLCRRQTGRCQWPDIPEACWEQAFSEMVTA